MSSESDADEIDTTIEEFLESAGGVGILVSVAERQKSFSEIAKDVEITSSTISKRRDEGLELGLISGEHVRRPNRATTEYELTDMGEAVVDLLAREGVVRNYREMRTLQRQVQDGTEAAIDQIEDNPIRIFAHPENFDVTLFRRDVSPDDYVGFAEEHEDREVTETEPVGDEPDFDPDPDQDVEGFMKQGSSEEGDENPDDPEPSE